MPHDPAAVADARNAFLGWAQRAGPPLVEPGAPIVGTVTLTPTGLVEGPGEGPVLGWSVIEAEDADAVARIIADHPFVSRGGSLQINRPAPV
jgi:hypothetical protein